MYSGDFPAARSEFEAILGFLWCRAASFAVGSLCARSEDFSLNYLAPVLWIAGYPDQAPRASIAAFECAAELNQANRTAYVHNFAGAGLDKLLGNVAGVRTHSEAILDVGRAAQPTLLRLNAFILQGWRMVQDGGVQSGIALMQQSAIDRAALSGAWYQLRYLLMLATAYAQLGQVEAGLRALDYANDLLTRRASYVDGGAQTGCRRVAAIKGEAAPLIENLFEQALSIARKQNAESFEPRAACSLAGLGRDQEDAVKPAISWNQSWAGSVKASARPWQRQDCSWRIWEE
jgi:hypothetical protein